MGFFSSSIALYKASTLLQCSLYFWFAFWYKKSVYNCGLLSCFFQHVWIKHQKWPEKVLFYSFQSLQVFLGKMTQSRHDEHYCTFSFMNFQNLIQCHLSQFIMESTKDNGRDDMAVPSPQDAGLTKI